MVTEASGVARPANACKPAQRYFLIQGKRILREGECKC